MINSYDDLKAQRAKAHNDLQVAKSRLTADTREWQDTVKPLNIVGTAAKKMFTNKVTGGNGKKGLVGKGVQMGINALLAKTALKSLPFPLNLILPHAAQNVAINYVDENGRDYLIKALQWVKEITEPEEEVPLLVAHVDPIVPSQKKLMVENVAHSDGTVEINTVPIQ